MCTCILKIRLIQFLVFFFVLSILSREIYIATYYNKCKIMEIKKNMAFHLTNIIIKLSLGYLSKN